MLKPMPAPLPNPSEADVGAPDAAGVDAAVTLAMTELGEGDREAGHPEATDREGAVGATLASTLDAIEILGIRAYGYTGFLAEERVLGQWFELDLSIWLDLSITGDDDELANSLDYAVVVERATSLLETCRYNTLERLNTVILEAVLALPPVQRVRSRLVKVAPPIPRFAGRIAVVMTRAKGSSS